MQSIFDKAAERDIRCGAPPATALLRCQGSLSSQGLLACFNVFPSKEVMPVKSVQQKDILHTGSLSVKTNLDTWCFFSASKFSLKSLI